MMDCGQGAEEWLRRLRARYDASAADYRDLWAPALRAAAARFVDELPLASARHVLDLGTGVGSHLPALGSAAPGATVVGVDLSRAMLSLAPRGCPLAVMDGSRLGIRDGAVDFVLAAFVLFHFEDPLRALQEARRVLAPGGGLGAITWGAESACPAQAAWTAELDAHGAAEADLSLARHDLLDSPERMRLILAAAGFAVERSWTAPFGARFDPETYLALKTRVGCSRSRFESLSLAAREACLARARERFRRMSADDFVDSTPLVYSIARVPG